MTVENVAVCLKIMNYYTIHHNEYKFTHDKNYTDRNILHLINNKYF
jgi:hypothetical protein